MSAFPDMPDHFMEWLKKSNSANVTGSLAAGFSPRHQYGAYLNDLWLGAINKLEANKRVTIYQDVAFDITDNGGQLYVQLENHPVLTADAVVLATGIDHQAVPAGVDEALLQSKHYFGDPWKRNGVKDAAPIGDILIIGNGLTMVDTVIGLRENGFQQTIHTISPRGYRLMRWREEKEPAPLINWTEVIEADASLLNLFGVFNKHRKAANRLGQTFYPAFDALRPHLQKIWQQLSIQEQELFASRIRSHWGNIRHRLPVEMFDIIENLRAAGKLVTYSGKIATAKQLETGVDVTLDLGSEKRQIMVQRIINCTGPESSIEKSGNPLLSNLAKKGLIESPPNAVGINADADNYRIITTKQPRNVNIFALGGNLKGVLWESTAVPELRVQAQKLAEHILAHVRAWQNQNATVENLKF